MMAVFSSAILTGCNVLPQDREKRAKEVLEEKYKQEFTIAEVFSQKFGDLYYDVRAYPTDDPTLYFTASIDTDKKACADNYVERRVCKEIREGVEQNLDGIPGYYYVFVHTRGPQPYASDPGINAEQYYALNPKNLFRAELYFLPDENADVREIYAAIEKLYAGFEYLNGDIRLWFPDDTKMAEIQEYLDTNDDLYFDYKKLTEGIYVLDISCRNGKPEITLQAFSEALEGSL